MSKGEPFWDLYRDGITRSALDTFLRCPELFRIKYVLGLESTRSSYAAEFGTVFHNACDHLYSAWKGGKDPQKWAAKFIKEHLDTEYEKSRKLLADDSLIEKLTESYALTEVLLRAYVKYWYKDFTEKEWIACEKVFDLPYPCPVNRKKTIRLRGKRDADFRIGKELWLFETKTKGRIDEMFIMDKLPLDLQTNLYMITQREEYGKTPSGVLYNVIRRPQLRKGVTETTETYCERVEADIEKRPEFYFIRTQGNTTKSELKRWEEEDFRGKLKSLVHWYEGLFHFRNDSSCEQAWGKCDALSYCSRGEDRFFRQRAVPFPEL